MHIDAAIAANIALGLMEPTGNGIGGDLFAIVWSAKDKKLYGLNASGPAPQDISIDYIKSKGLKKSLLLALPVSVPGAVDGWIKLHERFGNIDFKNLFDPTIKYAQRVFQLQKTIAYYFERSKSRYLDFPNFKETWMQSGDTPKKGRFLNPDLAKTLEEISKTKRKSFYEGRLAKEIARFIKDQGGFLSFEDMSNYQSEWVEPVSSNYRGYDVWELPPNGQGIAALQILNILEGFDLKAMGLNSAEYVHHFVEAKKIAFADRAKYYADPKFNNIDIKYLISKEYAELRRKKLIHQKLHKLIQRYFKKWRYYLPHYCR